jgi:hypothetical protein
MRFLTLAVGALALGAASPAQGQLLSTSHSGISRISLGARAIYAQPVGEFHDYVSQAWGGEGLFSLNLDRAGVASLRVSAGFLNYGNETKRVPLSPTLGNRIMVDLTTSNNILLLGAGPQLAVPSGPVRPYVNGSIGMSYFFTESSVEGANNNAEPFAQTTNHHDAVFAYGGGAGFLFPFSVRAQVVSLDIGAQYVNNGRATYLRKGGIIDNNDGTITLQKNESAANFVTYHIGVAVTLK